MKKEEPNNFGVLKKIEYKLQLVQRKLKAMKKPLQKQKQQLEFMILIYQCKISFKQKKKILLYLNLLMNLAMKLKILRHKLMKWMWKLKNIEDKA